jgi:hypothetical protein
MMQSALSLAERPAANAAQPASSRLRRACACASTGEQCARCASGVMQRSAASPWAGGSLPRAVHEVLAAPGAALDAGTRSSMQASFGQDLSHVRIHADTEAAQSASAVGAAAYTVGNHIAFAYGRYEPQTAEGRALLAHELTHVVQQGRAGAALQRDPAEPTEIDDDKDAEEEADLIAEAIAFGWPVKVSAKAKRAGLARQPFLGGAAGGCGICYRGNVRQIGIDAHNEIKLEFLRRYRMLMPEFPIIPKSIRGPIKKGIPDLIMATRTGFKIGEIKPANPEGYFEGEAKITIYERLLRARYKKVNPLLTLERLDVAPPLPFPFPDLLSVTCAQLLIVNPSVRGVYTYLCWPPFSAELRKRCRCAFDPPEKEDPAQKKTNKGAGISIGSSGGGMYNAGVGVSIYSSSSGIGNAGVGVSIASDSAAAGTLTAGGTVMSGGQAVGAVAEGGAYDSSGSSAGTAGIGGSKSSTAVAAGSAGAGTVSDSTVKGAGIAGAGKVEENDVEGSGVAASGTSKGQSGTAAGAKPEGEAQQGDASGKPGDTKSGAGTSAQGTTTPADKDKTGASGAPGAQAGGTKAADTKSDPGDKAGASGGPGTQTGGGAKPGETKPELLTPEEMQLLGLTGKPVPREAVETAIREAARIRQLIARSNPHQQALLRAIAERSPDGQYKVAAAEWIEKVLAATEGMTADDVEYLKTLDWKPAKVSAEELKKRVREILAKKPKGKDSARPRVQTDEGKGGGAKTAGKDDKAGSAKATAGAKGAEVTKHRVFSGFTDRERDFWFVDFASFDPVSTSKGDVKDMTIAFFGDDRAIYTYRMKFRVVARTVERETETVKGKPVARVVVYFDLEGLNDERWDVAPEGQSPFVLRKNAKARFRAYLR